MNSLRAVLDTNVVLAADRSEDPRSPNRKILRHAMAGDFAWLISKDIAAEYAEKLLEKGNSSQDVEAFITNVFLLAELIEIRFFHFRHYPIDLDDVAFLLCSVNGAATHMVTYDRHILDIGLFYDEFITCKPIDFLTVLDQQ